MLAVIRCLDEARAARWSTPPPPPSTPGHSRIDVDLRALDSYTDAGARALGELPRSGLRLPTVALPHRAGPGREALLAAYTDADLP